MRFCDSIFASLLKPINRRQFQSIVDDFAGDAYDKSFKSWDHLVALIHAQLSGADSLRGVVASFNANSHHHYHLGTGKLSRSTLSDASAPSARDFCTDLRTAVGDGGSADAA